MNFESEKADPKRTQKPSTAAHQEVASPDPGLSVWEELHQVLTARGSTV